MPEWLSLSFYLGLGWVGILTAYLVVGQYGKAEAANIFYGGLSYTVGAVLEFLRWPTLIEGVLEAHDLFHVFVILGAACHWYFIYEHASWPIYNKQIFIVKHNPQRSYFRAHAKGDDIRVTAQTLEELKEKIHLLIEQKYKDKLPIEHVLLQFFEEDEIDY
jgi:hypothetical protein